MRAFVLLFLLNQLMWGQIELRISTENRPSHIHTQIIKNFAQLINEKLGASLHAVHHDSGTLFRDKDVVNALARGQIEMAVPGNWHLDKFDRKAGVFLLPSFYGLDYDKLNTLRDGDFGKQINAAIERRTGTVVLGRWIDLGYAHIYSLNQPIRTYDDVSGMRIRVAGGLANIARMRALGANAVSISWGDLPQAMTSGKIDGILTTHETVNSAKLWKKGIRYCFEDSDYFPMYVPLISKKFYDRLSPELQTELHELWESQVDIARQKAASAQETARKTLVSNGVKIITPDQSAKDKARAKLQKAEPELLEQLGLDSEFVSQAFQK